MNENRTNGKDGLLTASEAAALLPNTSYQAIQRWAREGKIPSLVLAPSGRRFFRREDIENLLMPTDDFSAESGFEDEPLPWFEVGV